MTFDDAMYERIRAGAQRSAEIVAPRIDAAFKQPQTVVDFGGGEGWWAAEFATNDRVPVLVDIESPAVTAPGIVRVKTLDVDADTGAPRATFDLALCLEVVEHLPDAQGRALVGLLCNLAPAVAFSAAIPGQGGHGHVNEQWPGYWAAQFAEHGYACSDALRWEFWNDAEVEPWYRQNLLVFAPANRLIKAGLRRTPAPAAVVHPAIYGWRLQELGRLGGNYGY